MPKLPTLKPREILRVLAKAGFYVHHQRGSHIQLKHLVKPLRVTVQFHSNFDLPPEIIQSILKQSNLSRDEFLKLLKE